MNEMPPTIVSMSISLPRLLKNQNTTLQFYRNGIILDMMLLLFSNYIIYAMTILSFPDIVCIHRLTNQQLPRVFLA